MNMQQQQQQQLPQPQQQPDLEALLRQLAQPAAAPAPTVAMPLTGLMAQQQQQQINTSLIAQLQQQVFLQQQQQQQQQQLQQQPPMDWQQLLLANQLANQLVQATATTIPKALPSNALLQDPKSVILTAGSNVNINAFPAKLHQLLYDCQTSGQSNLVRWLSHGRGFLVTDPETFSSTILPRYFRMSRYASFQRQLNLYEFVRVTEGPDRGAYCHRLFVKGQPLLSTLMKRIKIKGRGTKKE